ncbi:MAG TPA: ABC transporter permease subunit [Candidatus Dormibacteraeota bacterium]|nr:ABC transporter permease subunit [Candidatus Dormibacteraeota bacterium]
MWFKSVLVKTLRDYRIAILGWGIGMGLVVVSPMATVSTLISTPQQRAELASLAASFAWNAELVAPTVGGYATFKIGIFIFLICVWPLLAASRMLRGEEERGSMDVLLSLPRSRVRVAVEKVAAMWVALLAMGVLIGLVAFAGGEQFKGDFNVVDALLFGLDLALVCAVFGGLALLISQFTQERGTAAGWTAALLLVFIVLDMVHRVIPNTVWISQLSPIYYYNLSKPLVPSYGASAGGMLVLAGLSVGLAAVAVWLFARRDVGDTVALPAWLRLPQRAARANVMPAGEWSLRSIYARGLGMVAMPTLWWTLGIAGGAAWFVVVIKQSEAKLQELASGSSFFQTLITQFGSSNAGFNANLLSAIFLILPLLLMAFAVTQVNRWSSDEVDGRLDIVLSTPQSRLFVLLGRFAALTTATIVIGVMTLAATALAASAAGLKLDTGNLAAATLGMIPMGLLVAAVGYLAAGWLRTAADTGLLSFLLAAWFFISFIGPDLKLPDGTLRLSPFYYYGTPLVHGLQLADMVLLVSVGVLALALGSVRFMRKDIAV